MGSIYQAKIQVFSNNTYTALLAFQEKMLVHCLTLFQKLKGSSASVINHHCLTLAWWFRAFYASVTLTEISGQKTVMKLDNLPQSSDLAQSNFWLFPNWRQLWKATDFKLLSPFSYIDKHLKSIPQKEFQKSCKQQKHQFKKYILQQKETNLKVKGTISMWTIKMQL